MKKGRNSDLGGSGMSLEACWYLRKEGRHLQYLGLPKGRGLPQECHTGQKVGKITKYKPRK